MPHLRLTTTADLHENPHVGEILPALLGALGRFETLDPKALKAYHAMVSNWAMGEGAPEGFAHVELALLAGRPSELRAEMADALYAAMREAFATSLEEDGISITVEIREMDATTYRKAAAP